MVTFKSPFHKTALKKEKKKKILEAPQQLAKSVLAEWGFICVCSQRSLCSVWGVCSSTISWVLLPRDSISAAAQRSTRLRGCSPRQCCTALGQGPAPSPRPLDGLQGPQELGAPPVLSVALAVLPHWAPQSLCDCSSGTRGLQLHSCNWGFFHLYP